MANLADIYKKASLVMKPAAMKEGKLYSQQPHSGDGDFTFSRANGVQTRINEHSLIETVADNTPRLSYNLDAEGNVSECPTLLLEPTRTNRVYPNKSFDGYSFLNATSSDNNSTSPDGAKNASLITSGSSGTPIGLYKGLTTSSSGVTHNISVFLKKGTHDVLKLQEGFASANMVVNLSNGTEVSSSNATNKKIEAYPNGWYRVSFNFTSASTNLQFSVYVEGTTSSGTTFYAFGGQIEEGSYATSYIPTEGTTEVRYSDNCIINNYKNAPTAYPFTVFCEMDIIEDEKGYGFSIIDVSSSSNYFSVGYSEDSGTLGKFRFTNRAQVTAYNFNTLSTYATGRHKIAVKFISSTNFKGFINGAEVADYTHSSSPFNTNIKDILLGQLRAPGDTGHRNPISQFILFNESLSDSELITLTT